ITGAVSAAYPVSARVRPGDNTMVWDVVQTASDYVEGVSNQISLTWKNLGDPAGANAYPNGTLFGVLVQRISPQLNLSKALWYNDGARTDYRVLPFAAAGVVAAHAAGGDGTTYGYAMIVDPLQPSAVKVYTPADDPYGWTASAYCSDANVTALAADLATGVEPATLRPQIVELTLAGTVTTGWTYRVTLEGVDFDYVATGGDTSMDDIAVGVAAVVDADASYIGSSAGAVVTIEHASDNTPFTYSASIIPSTVTLSAAITQEAI
ncbi:MAG: hypothetical protein OEU93_08080, partial [Rubrivivax sp.]|nr:hypothetical protein [Rubrivivax sp.]